MDIQDEQCAAIRFCVCLSKTPTETHNLMKQAYGDECLAKLTAKQ